jgi:phenylacetate-CoA ligase
MSVKVERRLGIFNRSIRNTTKLLSEADRLSADQLRQLNWERRKSLVLHCYQNIKYYQDKFKEIGFEGGDLKSEDDFQRLPIIEKEDIREHEEELVFSMYKKRSLPFSTTGGTTGTPLKVYQDPNIHASPMLWRMLYWWGLKPGDNRAYLYRACPKGFRKLIQDVFVYPSKRVHLAAAEMTEENMEIFYRKLLATKSSYILGYVGSIDSFASYIDARGLLLPDLNAVWTTSSPLPEMKRKHYQNIFNCPVFTQYGSCEFSMISAECPHKSGLHVMNDVRHVDIVNKDKCVSGESPGDIVVTDLLNYAFPLLRYRIGDRGRLLEKGCDCSLPFPMMDYVQGRISDNIKLIDGTSIPGEFLTTIFDDHSNEISSFKVLQRKDYSLTIRFKPKGQNFENSIKQVKSMLEDKLLGQVTVNFIEEQTEIDMNENGKARYVVSEIE